MKRRRRLSNGLSRSSIASPRGVAVECSPSSPIIRAAILHVIRTSLDDVHKLTIDPPSVSAVGLEPSRVLYLNRDVVDVPRLPLSAVGSANTRAIQRRENRTTGAALAA